MTSLLDDIHTSAQWIARALNRSGYKAEFIPGSVRDVERFMDELFASATWRQDGHQ